MAKTSLHERKDLSVEEEKKLKEILAKFERYLPSPQDVAVHRRKVTEYIDEFKAWLKEGGMSDGRDGGNDGDNGNGSADI